MMSHFLVLGLLCLSVPVVTFHMHMKIVDRRFDALLFDCDGVIAETERDGHRVSFNEAFKAKNLNNMWDVGTYGKLLRIGGGKERMTAYFDEVGWPKDVSDKKAYVQELHLLKTAKFQTLVESGSIPLRPGVARLVDDALANGIKVGVCSTSNEAAVTTIVKTLLGPLRFAKMKIYAGDIVSKKKPAPDVYLLAAKELGVDPEKCWVIEDSEIGLKAAKSAGMRCVVTKSIYSQDEDFRNADICISDLDNGLDGQVTAAFLNYKATPFNKNAVKTNNNADTFAATPDLGKMFSKIADGKSGNPFM